MNEKKPAYGGQEAIDRMHQRMRIGPGEASSGGKVIGRTEAIIVDIGPGYAGHALRAERRGEAIVLTSRGWTAPEVGHYVGDDCEPDGHRSE